MALRLMGEIEECRRREPMAARSEEEYQECLKAEHKAGELKVQLKAIGKRLALPHQRETLCICGEY